MRSPFQRDRDRIIHSTAFRRLKHKTQVFVYHEGDHYRTRLTHSLEVAQIARTIARALGLDEDLAEALALAHDLGHTPFGHAGEEALNAEMAPYGGFSHNDQTLRILTRLERRYAEFDGLNLTWETLEGTVKHNGPLLGPPASSEPCRPRSPNTTGVIRSSSHTFPGPEAQVAALADDIAYNNHDLDDGLRAGLFAVADLADVPLVGPVFARGRAALSRASTNARLIHEAIRRVIDRMVRDLIGETARRLAGERRRRAPTTMRALGAPVAAFSDEMRNHDRALKRFLFERMYRHHRVNRMSFEGAPRRARAVSAVSRRAGMPAGRVAPRRPAASEAERARVVADYLAGMTDRFALDEHRRLFDTYAPV